VTTDPPAGAVCVSVTVHVLTAPALNVMSEHVTGERVGTVIVPPTADATARPFPLESTPLEFDI